MGVFDANLNWSDGILCAQERNGTHSQVEASFASLFNVLMGQAPYSNASVIDVTLDLSTCGSNLYLNAGTFPAGSLVVSVAAILATNVVAGGTTVKVGLGTHDGTLNSWGNIAALTKNSTISKLFNDAVLSGSTALDVCAVATGGSAAGDTAFASGTIRVLATYYSPTALPTY